MDLIFNIEKGVAHGAITGALSPFVTANETSAADAAEMANALTDAFELFHANQGKPPVDLGHAAAQGLRAAIYAALQPFVDNGSTTAAKASEIAYGVTNALALLSNVIKNKNPAPA